MADAPQIRLTEAKFSTFNTAVGAVDAGRIQPNSLAIVAHATFEAGGTEQPQYHTVIKVQGTALLAEGEGAAVRDAWKQFHRLMLDFADQAKDRAG